jgi:hypothetical protein
MSSPYYRPCQAQSNSKRINSVTLTMGVSYSYSYVAGTPGYEQQYNGGLNGGASATWTRGNIQNPNSPTEEWILEGGPSTFGLVENQCCLSKCINPVNGEIGAGTPSGTSIGGFLAFQQIQYVVNGEYTLNCSSQHSFNSNFEWLFYADGNCTAQLGALGEEIYDTSVQGSPPNPKCDDPDFSSPGFGFDFDCTNLAGSTHSFSIDYPVEGQDGKIYHQIWTCDISFT